jgi:adenylate cyclase class IV
MVDEFPIGRMGEVIARYRELEELIEEFEHLAMAREDKDEEAEVYFQRQRRLRRSNGKADVGRDVQSKEVQMSVSGIDVRADNSRTDVPNDVNGADMHMDVHNEVTGMDTEPFQTNDTTEMIQPIA